MGIKRGRRAGHAACDGIFGMDSTLVRNRLRRGEALDGMALVPDSHFRLRGGIGYHFHLTRLVTSQTGAQHIVQLVQVGPVQACNAIWTNARARHGAQVHH